MASCRWMGSKCDLINKQFVILEDGFTTGFKSLDDIFYYTYRNSSFGMGLSGTIYLSKIAYKNKCVLSLSSYDSMFLIETDKSRRYDFYCGYGFLRSDFEELLKTYGNILTEFLDLLQPKTFEPDKLIVDIEVRQILERHQETL